MPTFLVPATQKVYNDIQALKVSSSQLVIFLLDLGVAQSIPRASFRRGAWSCACVLHEEMKATEFYGPVPGWRVSSSAYFGS